MKTVGLALSGGGARGFAHLGIVKALREFGITPSIISGASAGAMMGAFLADGHSPEEILEISKKAEIFKLSHMLWRKNGFFEMKAIEDIYLQHFPHNCFENLQIPLHIATTDIVKGESVYFSTGTNLAKSIMASSCIPVLFEPVELEGRLLLDGGILNNFPVEPLVGKCDKIIGISVNSLSQNIEHIQMKDMVDRSCHIALKDAVVAKATLCDLFIEPPDMSRFGVLDIELADDIFGFSYSYALTLKEKIEAFVEGLGE